MLRINDSHGNGTLAFRDEYWVAHVHGPRGSVDRALKREVYDAIRAAAKAAGIKPELRTRSLASAKAHAALLAEALDGVEHAEVTLTRGFSL